MPTNSGIQKLLAQPNACLFHILKQMFFTHRLACWPDLVRLPRLCRCSICRQPRMVAAAPQPFAWAAMQWRRHGISVGLGSLSALELVPVQQHCRISLDLLRGPFLNGGYIGVVLNRGVALDAAGMLRCRATLPESFEVDVEAGHAVSLEVGAAALGRSGDDLSRPDSTKQAIGRKGFSLALAALCLSALGVDSTKHPA